jgi:putative acetyltransferase
MSGLEIAVADPAEPGVRALVERQLEHGRAASPPEDAHALDVAGLGEPGITVFAARDGGEVVAVGALKELGPGQGELKAMHTAEAARGRGIGRAMLAHLLGEARRRGYRRVSLETGSMEAFAPARSLYLGTGFAACRPFGDYRESPNSVYLALDLD